MRISPFIIALLMIPSTTLAAFNTPAEALGATRNGGIPREFTAQAHNQGGDIHLSTWVNGVQEGTGEWMKLRMDVTTHMQQQHDFLSMKMRVLVYQNMLYYTITEANLHSEDELIATKLNSMLKKWVALPLPTSVDAGSAWNFVDIIDAVDMDALDISLTWDDVRTSLDTLTMEHTKYSGGDAYSMYSTESGRNLHIRLNTTSDGTLSFGKYYLQDGSFVFEGSMQPHGSTVNLDIPKHTVSSTEFAMHLLGFEFPMMYGNVPIQPVHSLPEEYYEEPRPLIKTRDPQIPESRNYVEYAKRSGVAQEERITCAWPGTLDAVELQRKGICPTDKMDKRDIRVTYASTPTGMEMREQRVSEDRIVDSYNTIAEKFELSAHRRDLHRVKTMLSRASLTTVGSDGVDGWITSEVIPYFVPMMRSSIVEYMLLEDDRGNDGIALQKMVVSESGRRKDAVIILFKQDSYSEPVIADVFLNTKLRDLRMDGIIE